MAKVNEVEEQIQVVEGFNVRLVHQGSGRAVRRDRADLEDYPEVRASRDSDSVRGLDRWQPYWSDGMSVEVLNRDGSVADVDTAPSSVDFGVLTDGERDWWYAFSNTNYYLGYETGESTPATVDERRARLLNFSNQIGGFITVPDHLATSLTGDDLKWLRGVQELPVVYKPGSLRRL